MELAASKGAEKVETSVEGPFETRGRDGGAVQIDAS